MDFFSNLVKSIPWNTLKNNAVIIVVSIILIVFLLYSLIQYRKKNISFKIKNSDNKRIVSKYENETKQKEIENPKTVDIDLKNSVCIDNVEMGNFNNLNTPSVKISVGDGSKLKNSKVGNINAREH